VEKGKAYATAPLHPKRKQKEKKIRAMERFLKGEGTADSQKRVVGHECNYQSRKKQGRKEGSSSLRSVKRRGLQNTFKSGGKRQKEKQNGGARGGLFLMKNGGEIKKTIRQKKPKLEYWGAQKGPKLILF